MVWICVFCLLDFVCFAVRLPLYLVDWFVTCLCGYFDLLTLLGLLSFGLVVWFGCYFGLFSFVLM